MLTIHTFCFNAFQENTFVIFNSEREAIIVDPGCYLKHEQVATKTLANNYADDYIEQYYMNLYIQQQLNKPETV